MKASVSSSDFVHLAYRLLEQDMCYDKVDLFLRANVAAYEASDLFQKMQDVSAMIVDELRKRTPILKSQRAIKAWQESDYATIIAVVHLYGLSRDDFAYILDTFPVLKKKEKKAFGEFMSKRKCLEEYDRIEGILAVEREHS